MNTIEKLTAARNRALNTAAMTNEYKDSWGSDFALKELAMGFSTKSGFGFTEIPVITKEELVALDKCILYEFGFGNWDGNLVLIPLWVVGFMDENEEVTSISGDKKKLSECDKDVRFGCIAWGFV